MPALQRRPPLNRREAWTRQRCSRRSPAPRAAAHAPPTPLPIGLLKLRGASAPRDWLPWLPLTLRLHLSHRHGEVPSFRVAVGTATGRLRPETPTRMREFPLALASRAVQGCLVLNPAWLETRPLAGTISGGRGPLSESCRCPCPSHQLKTQIRRLDLSAYYVPGHFLGEHLLAGDLPLLGCIFWDKML